MTYKAKNYAKQRWENVISDSHDHIVEKQLTIWYNYLICMCEIDDMHKIKARSKGRLGVDASLCFT